MRKKLAALGQKPASGSVHEKNGTYYVLAMSDVARISGYNPKVVHRWTLSGDLSCIEIKRRKYVTKNDLIRYMSSQRHIGKIKKPEKHRHQLSEILKGIDTI